jgi:hypothetical protein
MPYAVPVMLKETLWPLSVTYTHCDQSHIWVFIAAIYMLSIELKG